MAKQLDDRDTVGTAPAEARRTPFDTLTEAFGGLLLGHCVVSVARCRVADALGDTPLTAGELAEASGVNPDAVGRMLRLLAAHGVFRLRDGRFAHTGASELLRTDHPYSFRDFVAGFGAPSVAEVLGLFDHSLQTGIPATFELDPGGIFGILQRDPEFGQHFDAGMTAKARTQVASILAAYDFTSCGAVGDIGGSRGHLLRAVLDAAPGTTGVLFDLPRVIEGAAGTASERLALRAGDFFTDPLPACNTYLLMDVIHDWDDEPAAAILSAVREAAPERARLLLIESVIPDVPGPDWRKTLDVLMLVATGGRQRTLREHESLLGSSGFRLNRVVDTASDVSILEATTV